MYAIVATGGKQLIVQKDAVAVVEKLDAAVGEAVTLPVLLVADGDSILVGADAEGAFVTGTVLEHFKGQKQIVFKFKKRKGYKRMKGHRQDQTSVLITEISAEAPKKPAKKPAKKAAEPEVVETEATEPIAVEPEIVEAAEAPVKKPAAKKTVKKADEAAE